VCLTIGIAHPLAADGRRVAVVVGVGAYQTVPQLPNPPRDARAVAAALARLGFDTTLVVDPDRAQLEQAVRTLGEKARNADAAVFFYAGHALEADSRNYLVPVNARIESRRDVPFETVDLDLVGEQVEGRARMFVAFLDACRDNPFASRLFSSDRGIRLGTGLAAPASDAAGTLIAYATAPGHTAEDGDGEDSPFTTALLHHIATPNLEVRQLLGRVRKDVREATEGRQVPWESSALEGEFYFNPLGNPLGNPAGRPDLPAAAPIMPMAAAAPVVPTAAAAARPPARLEELVSAGAPAGAAAPPLAPYRPMPMPQQLQPPPLMAAPDDIPILPRVMAAPATGGAGLATGSPPPPRTQQFAGITTLAEPTRSAAAARCHVDPVADLRRSGGAETVMEVANDGHPCFFRVALPGTERQSYDTLALSHPPARGALRVIDNALVVYTPRAGVLGEDRFVLTSRPAGTLTVRVIVRPAMPPPPAPQPG
jgi:hypothetical protein